MKHGAPATQPSVGLNFAFYFHLLLKCIRFVIANSSLRLSLQVGLLIAAAEKKVEECETRP
jgi:hypothetical protein